MTRMKFVLTAAVTFALPASMAFAEDEAAAEKPEGGDDHETDASGGEAPDSGEKVAPEPDKPTPTSAPPAGPQLTLGKGKLLIGGQTLNVGLIAGDEGKPISLAPSVWYGVSDKLTVGVTHDGGTTPWTPRPGLRFTLIDFLGTLIPAPVGNGICVSGEDGGCAKVYNNISVDGLFSLKADAFSLAAHPALDINSFDPMTLSLRVGVLGRLAVNDKISVAFDPRVKIGITERDFNKEEVDVPVWLWFMATDKIGVALQTGIAGPLDGFADAFTVPVGVDLNFSVNEKLMVGADFSFLNLIGKNGDADARMLGIRAQYAL